VNTAIDLDQYFLRIGYEGPDLDDALRRLPGIEG
jgi:hypothetical protein